MLYQDLISCLYDNDQPLQGHNAYPKRKDFEKLITNYILNRKNLVNLFILVDIRHTPQKIDLEFMEWCAESGIPFSVIFTKADKLKPNAVTQNVETYQQKLLETWEELPELYITSAERKEGGENILNFIEHTNEYLRKHNVKFK